MVFLNCLAPRLKSVAIYIEIGYYFGISPIEEIVRKRRDKFNSYGASDNCLCQLLYCKA